MVWIDTDTDAEAESFARDLNLTMES